MAQAGYVTNAVRPLITGTGAEPSTNLVRTAHGEFLAVLAARPPWPIPVGVNAADLEGRGGHLGKVLTVLAVYPTAILGDTAQNDLVSEVIGTVGRAADHMAGRVA